MSTAPETSRRIVRVREDGDLRVFNDIARLHRNRLAAGALAQMTEGFLASFYHYLASRNDCVVFVALKDKNVSGFIAGTKSGSTLLRSYALSDPAGTIKHGAVLLLRPRLLLRIVSLIFFLLRGETNDRISDSQLLSIAVNCTDSRTGVGADLFEALSCWFREMYSTSFDIIVAETQTAAIKFYKRCGAVIIGQTELGGLHSIHFRSKVEGGF